jgi:transposase
MKKIVAGWKSFVNSGKEVRGSSEYLLVGIDVAKEKHYAFFGTAQGKTLLRRLVFENNIEGFRKLLGQAGAMKD